MLDYINGNRFEELVNELSKVTYFTKGILFSRTSAYLSAFNVIRNNPLKKYILITHMDDQGTNKQMFLSRPSNLKYWYAQSASYDHPDLIPIPAGLQDDYGYNADPNNNVIISDNFVRWQNIKERIEDVIYCNWSNTSNAIRRNLLPKLDANNIKYVWEPSNTYGRKEYYDHVSNYRFVLSPPGTDRYDPIHGEAHRTWELLYVGCTPIVIKSNIFKEFGDHPIIQIDDYSEVTYDLLNQYLINKERNTEKIFMKYWRERIMNQFNILS